MLGKDRNQIHTMVGVGVAEANEVDFAAANDIQNRRPVRGSTWVGIDNPDTAGRKSDDDRLSNAGLVEINPQASRRL